MWYPGTITQKINDKYQICYDDGDKEEIDLSKEKYKFINYPKIIKPPIEESDTEPEDNQIKISDISDMEEISDDDTKILNNIKNDNIKSIITSQDEDNISSISKIQSPIKSQPPIIKRYNVIDDDEDEEIDISFLSKSQNKLQTPNKLNKLNKYKDSDEDEEIDISFLKSQNKSRTKNKLNKDEDEYNFNEIDSESETSHNSKTSQTRTPNRNKSKTLYSTPKRVKAVDSPKTPKTPNSVITTRGSTKTILEEGTHEHHKNTWLNTNLRDKYGHKPDDIEYDCHTLKVPSDYFAKQTPGLKQWWTLKTDYFDTILFFKLGKFYELYHFDADVAVKELGLTYMKGEFAHAGFPEPAYPKYSKILIDKGYRVARIEQTETPLMLKERNSGKSSKDKCVNREICNIVTKGTQIYTVYDDSYKINPNRSYLLSIFEDNNKIGLCWTDTASGMIKLTEFEDDKQKSLLRTIIIEIHPSEILYSKQNISSESMSMLKYEVSDALFTTLQPKQFYNSKQVFDCLNKEKYFISESNPDNKWPDSLISLLNENKNEFQSNYSLSIRSFGGLIYYLHYCAIDYHVISMKNVTYYNPQPIVNNIVKAPDFENSIIKYNNIGLTSTSNTVTIDGITIQNLELFNNNVNNDSSGTLYDYLDHCKTQFGKRLLKQIIYNPPNDINIINEYIK